MATIYQRRHFETIASTLANSIINLENEQEEIFRIRKSEDYALRKSILLMVKPFVQTFQADNAGFKTNLFLDRIIELYRTRRNLEGLDMPENDFQLSTSYLAYLREEK